MLSAHTSKQPDKPILIVDKTGVLGQHLADVLKENYLIVLVSGTFSEKVDNLIHVPFKKSIPQIPDNYYSHTFLIEEGGNLSKSASSFVRKAREDQSQLILIENIRDVGRTTLHEVKSYRNSKVIFVGDLFSHNSALSDVDLLFSEVKKTRKIKLEGEGLFEIFPVFLQDVVEKIIKEIFVEENPNKVINIFQKTPLTMLSLSRLIQSIDPLIGVDFVKKKERKDHLYAEHGDFVLGENYDLRKKVKEVLEQELPADFKQLGKLGKQVEKGSFLRGGVLALVLFVVFFLFLPLLTTVGYSLLGLYQLEKTSDNIEKGNISEALKSSNSAKTFFSFASKTMVPLKAEVGIIGREDVLSPLSEKVDIGNEISKASFNILSSAQKIKNIFDGKSQNPSKEFSESLNELSGAVTQFRKIEAQKDQVPGLSERIKNISPSVDLLASSIDILKPSLGFDEELKYLILFQNNMELRPGGGFIGSFATFGMKDGRVKDFEIQDVYSADGQLKDHVEPPFPLRRYLPQPNWYLRDSNFDVNFLRNASTAANFLELETGQKVDGVLAIDIEVVKKLLKAIGPVKVDDYDVTVNEGNLYKITQEQSEKNFFPGSTKKKDFLSSLLKSMELAIGEEGNLPLLTLSLIVSESLKEKHLMLSSMDPIVQEVLSANSWSGEVGDRRPTSKNKINDFFGVNEANLGINKVNYQISRSVSKAQIIDDEGAFSSTVTLSLKNESPKLNYKNYLRFLLPGNAQITEISFDNVSTPIIPAVSDPKVFEATNFKKPFGVEVEEKIEDGVKVVGFLVEVGPDSLKNISLTYSLSPLVSLDSKVEYSLSFYKQPGIDTIPLEFSFYYPKGYKVLSANSTYEKLDNKIGTSTNIKEDTLFNFSFSKE